MGWVPLSAAPADNEQCIRPTLSAAYRAEGEL